MESVPYKTERERILPIGTRKGQKAGDKRRQSQYLVDYVLMNLMFSPLHKNVYPLCFEFDLKLLFFLDYSLHIVGIQK